jgi:hypothetical protein
LLAITWDKRKRAWHDRIVGTYVVRTSRVPGDVVQARSLATRGKGESHEDSETTTAALMLLIVVVFAPGLIVLFAFWWLLGKVGIIKRKPKAEAKPAE